MSRASSSFPWKRKVNSSLFWLGSLAFWRADNVQRKHSTTKAWARNFDIFSINFDSRHHHQRSSKGSKKKRKAKVRRKGKTNCNKLSERVSWTLKVKMNFGWSSTVLRTFISRPISDSFFVWNETKNFWSTRVIGDIFYHPFSFPCLFWSHNGNVS